LEEVRTLGMGVSVSARILRGRVLALARFAETAKVTAIERPPPEWCTTTLIAFVHTLEATAQDDALDLLDVLLTDIFSKAEDLGRKARLRTSKDLDAAALQTSAVCAVLLDLSVPEHFGASPAGGPVLEAILYVRVREETGPRGWPEPTLTIANNAWRYYVVPNGTVAYVST
jgi:hypothetical protein